MGATHGCICCEHPDHARRFTERPCEKCFPEDDVKDGLTPLMRAAVRGHDKCADILTHAGANVNKIHTVSWFYDFSALIYAANGGHDRCVNSLIQVGADVNYSHKNQSVSHTTVDRCLRGKLQMHATLAQSRSQCEPEISAKLQSDAFCV